MWSNNTKGVVKSIGGVEKVCAEVGEVTVTSDLGEGSNYRAYQYLLTFSFTKDTINQVCEAIDAINKEVSILNESGVDIALRFVDFDALKRVGGV